MISYLQRYYRPMMIVIFGVISISFIFFTSMPSQDNQPENMSVGKIDGHTITVGEFHRAQRGTSTLVTLATGQIPSDSGEAKKQLAQQTWQRMLFLSAAKRMGVVVNSQQIIEFIQQQPLLSEKGQYSPQVYAQFERVYLLPRGISPSEFEQIITDELKIQKVIRSINSPVTTTEAELADEMNSKFGSTTLVIARLNADNYLPQVKIDPKEIEDAYNKNKLLSPALQTREKRKVSYVSFPIPAGSKDDAKQKIAEKALTFAQQLDKNDNLTKADFAPAAQKESLPISKTDWFALDETPAGISPSPNFNRAAFTLMPERPISSVVETDKAYYVLCLEDEQPAQPKPLSEVKALIEQQLKANKAAIMAAEAGKTATMQLKAAVASGTPFAAAAAKLNLKTETISGLIPADPADRKDKTGIDDTLRAIAANLSVHQVSPYYGSNKGGMIAWVESRQPYDKTKFSKFSEFIQSDLLNRKRMNLLGQWLQWQSNGKGTVKPDLFLKSDDISS